MKRKISLFLALFVTLVISDLSVFAQKEQHSKYISQGDQQQKSSAARITGALEHYKMIRNNQITGEFNMEDFYAAREHAKLLNSLKTSSVNWSSIGPTDQGGRVRSLLIDKNNSQVIYAGSVSGGIWKSTNSGQSWFSVDNSMESHIISCMHQAPNGIIWVGTGENFAPVLGSVAGGTGFVGWGIFKSTDASGTAFEHVPSTTPTNLTPTAANGWQYVYRIKVAPNGHIYAAMHNGARVSKDNGVTWENPLGTITTVAHDIDISTDGNIISIVAGKRVYISKNGGVDFTVVPTGTGGLPPAPQILRIEVDISPSNPNYIYAVAASTTTQELLGVHRSTDAGDTWTIIGPGGSDNFNPLYGIDLVCKVHPTNPNKIYVGGLDMWTWEENGNWEQKSLWALSEFSPYFLHDGHHEYIFQPGNPNIMYFATDGGISKSYDGGTTFEVCNRNFVTLQSYAMSISKKGGIITGTQGNGTLYMSRQGYLPGQSTPLLSGNGGYSAFSYLNDKLFFASVPYGDVVRTPTGDHDGIDVFYDDWVKGIPGHEDDLGGNATNFASFVTPLVLHEKTDDYLSPDSVKYTHIGATVYTGDTIIVYSNTSGYTFEYIIPSEIGTLNEDDEIMVQDIVTSKFYVGLKDYVIMTRQSHEFYYTPEWWPIHKFSPSQIVQTMAVSKCGNYLFVGTTTGKVFRMSNLNYANDFQSASYLNTKAAGNAAYTEPNPFCVVETKEFGFSGTPAPSNRAINGISVDPNNPNNVVVVAGNYGNTRYVYYSTNALSATPTFTHKQGSGATALPQAPVYSALIIKDNPKTVLVGTEFGVYKTNDITVANPQWESANSGVMLNVPVYDLKQQIYNFPGTTNYGIVYAATHGRGIFETFNFVSVPQYDAVDYAKPKLLKVYPNPATDEISFNIPANSNEVKIYNINGKLIIHNNIDPAIAGKFTIDISSLNDGIYFIELRGAGFIQFAKFIKMN